MQKRPSTSLAALFAATLSAALLTGCSTSFQPNPIQTDQSSIGTINGMVHGGQAAISGAHIYLYAAGTSGYGKPATSILTDTPYADSNGSYVLTDNSGNFSISGNNRCTVGTQVYMIATGGNPGLSPGTNNTAIVQMAGLGECGDGNLGDLAPYVVVNEVTTVAFAYSMGGFATTAFNVSIPGTTQAQQGIANAMANTSNIVNLQYGQAPTTANGNHNSTVPQTKIYTLANILASCVNTSGPTSTQCSTLLTYATTSAGNKAGNEAEAIFNMVHNPTENIARLYPLGTANPAFAPALTRAPTDWTVPIIYKNAISTYGTNGTTIISGCFDEAVDADGNIWIGDEGRGVVEIGPQGAVSTYNTNKNGVAFTEIKGVAVSPNGSIWASDGGESNRGVYVNQITILNSAGAPTFTSAPGAGGLNGPAGIAFDAAGDTAWVANDNSGTMSLFNSAGTALKTGAYTFNGNGLDGPAWIAVDSLNDAFAPSQASTYLGGLASGLTAGTVTSISEAYALAIDSSNNLWMVANGTTGPLYEVQCTQTKNRNTGKVTGVTCASQGSVNGGGMDIPDRVALDGGGVLWLANQGAETVSARNIKTNAWVASAGFSTGASDDALDAVPDISGNLWVANKDGTVSQILGLATPTAAPLVPGNYEKMP